MPLYRYLWDDGDVTLLSADGADHALELLDEVSEDKNIDVVSASKLTEVADIMITLGPIRVDGNGAQCADGEPYWELVHIGDCLWDDALPDPGMCLELSKLDAGVVRDSAATLLDVIAAELDMDPANVVKAKAALDKAVIAVEHEFKAARLPTPDGFREYNVPDEYKPRLGEVIWSLSLTVIAKGLDPATIFAAVPMTSPAEAKGLLLSRNLSQVKRAQFDAEMLKEALAITLPSPRYLLLLVDTPVKSFVLAVDVDFAAKNPPTPMVDIDEPTRSGGPAHQQVLTLVKGSSASN